MLHGPKLRLDCCMGMLDCASMSTPRAPSSQVLQRLVLRVLCRAVAVVFPVILPLQLRMRRLLNQLRP